MQLQPPPCKDEKFYRQWGIDHPYCQACGISYSKARFERWPGLSTHHIIKPHRAHEATVLLRLCQRDHDLAEGRTIRVNGVVLPKLTIGICLSIKLAREPEVIDWARLTQLYGQTLPDLEAIPEFLEVEFRSRRGRV